MNKINNKLKNENKNENENKNTNKNKMRRKSRKERTETCRGLMKKVVSWVKAEWWGSGAPAPPACVGVAQGWLGHSGVKFY